MKSLKIASYGLKTKAFVNRVKVGYTFLLITPLGPSLSMGPQQNCPVLSQDIRMAPVNNRWHQSTTALECAFTQCLCVAWFVSFSDICPRSLCSAANTIRRTTPRNFANFWTRQLTSSPTVKASHLLGKMTRRTRRRCAGAHQEKMAPTIKYPRQFQACGPL